MGRTVAVLSGVILFAAGFLCGHLDSAMPSTLKAQKDDSELLTDQGLTAYQKARKGVVDLNDMFVAIGRTTTATSDVNYFSVGGTLGIGLEIKQFGLDVSQYLDSDELGRIRYKKKVVQLYSTARLNELFNRRDELRILSSNK